MTDDEAVTMLLDGLGLSVAAVGEARASACRAILADALAAEEKLPTSWFEVWDFVAAMERRGHGDAGPFHDFRLIYGPLNQAVNTMNVSFPREFW